MYVRLATDMKCAGDDDGSGGPQPMGIPLGRLKPGDAGRHNTEFE